MPHVRRTALPALAGVLVALALAAPASATDVVPASFTTGANVTDWSTDGYDRARDVLQAARADGIRAVSLVPTLYMTDASASRVARDPDMTPSDESLRAAAAEARSLGLAVTIKPHVDVLDGSYRGSIAPADPDAWFASYAAMLDHYARLAADVGATTLVVGTELDSMAGDQASWLRMIAATRRTFSGSLTYAANWNAVAAVPFWSALDEIGVDAYVPLGDADSTPAQLRAAWQPLVAELAALHTSTGKPVSFTELGYQSRSDGLRTPFDATGPSDEGVQARGYAAAFAVWGALPWFRGISWWDLPVNPGASSAHDGAFSFRGKAAEEVLRAATGATGPIPAPNAPPAGARSILPWLAGLAAVVLTLAVLVAVLRRRAPDRRPALRLPVLPLPPIRVPPLRIPALAALRIPALPAVRVPALPLRLPTLPLPALRIPVIVAPIIRAPGIRRLVTRRRSDGGPAQPVAGSAAMLQGDAGDVVDPVRMACLLAGPAAEPLLLQARFVLDSHAVVLFLRDPRDAAVVHAAMGVGVPEDLIGRQFSSADGLMGHVLQTGNAISVADRSQLPDAISHPLIADATAALSVPVRLDGRVIGALTVTRDDAFAPSERHLLAPLADAIAQLLPPWLIGASWPA